MKSNMTSVTSEQEFTRWRQNRPHGPDKHFRHLKCLNQRMYLKHNRQTFGNLLSTCFFDEFRKIGAFL